MFSISSEEPKEGVPQTEVNLRPFQKLKGHDYAKIISSVALPIIVIVALGLSIHYGIHPIGKMIPITPDLSISLPLMITTGTGGVAILTFVVLLTTKSFLHSYERAMGHIVYKSEDLRELVRKALHPSGRREGQTAEEFLPEQNPTIKKVLGEMLGDPEIVEFRTLDKILLRGVWNYKAADAPTVVLFHGNGGFAYQKQMREMSDYYYSIGFNVLIPEYRGYTFSEGIAGAKTQEIEAYLDVDAVHTFLKEKKVPQEKVVAHGFSLGGSYAAALGLFCNVPNVILDHTFTSFPAVMEHVLNSVKISVTATSTVNMTDAAYEGNEIKREEGQIPLKADNWDSLAKVQRMKGEIFVIQGEKDDMMPLEFGDAFMKAKYASNEDLKKARLVTVEKGHNDGPHFFEVEDAKEKHRQFLKERKVIPS